MFELVLFNFFHVNVAYYDYVGVQNHMQKFTTYIVNLMKQEKLFASQGGPIILSQASVIVVLVLYLLLTRSFGSFSRPSLKCLRLSAVPHKFLSD